MKKTETILDKYIETRFDANKSLTPFDIESDIDLTILNELARYTRSNPRVIDENAQILYDRLNISGPGVKDFFEVLLQSTTSELILDRTRFVQ